MKHFGLILASILMAPLCADTIYTVPQGYTKMTVAAGSVAEGPKLTAISASLLQDVEYAGQTTLGTYTDAPAPASDTQELDFSGVAWTPGQWTISGAESSPYIVYVSQTDDPGNADGINPPEEAFLITSNTADKLVVNCNYDLATRFPATASIKIRKANTLDSFFGNLSEDFGGNDFIYVWDGDGWESFQFSGGTWIADDPFTDVGPTTVIHPDEGVFISRAGTTDIIVTLFGEVPAAPQIATITGAGFVASRFPFDTTLGNSGIANASWTGNDFLYIWNPDASPNPSWDSYQFSGGTWIADDPFTPVDDTVIPANSAVFISREAPVSGENGGTTSALPYAVDQ